MATSSGRSGQSLSGGWSRSAATKMTWPKPRAVRTTSGRSASRASTVPCTSASRGTRSTRLRAAGLRHRRAAAAIGFPAPRSGAADIIFSSRPGANCRSGESAASTFVGLRADAQHQPPAHPDPLVQGPHLRRCRPRVCGRFPAGWWRGSRRRRLRSRTTASAAARRRPVGPPRAGTPARRPQLARLLHAQRRVAHGDDQVLRIPAPAGNARRRPAARSRTSRRRPRRCPRGTRPSTCPATRPKRVNSRTVVSWPGESLAGFAGGVETRPGTPSPSGTITDSSPASGSLPPRSVTSTCVHSPAL